MRIKGNTRYWWAFSYWLVKSIQALFYFQVLDSAIFSYFINYLLQQYTTGNGSAC